VGANFFVSQAAAVVVAMTANFFFNNLFTYADRRLKGARILRGILIFYLTCAGGAVINLAVAVYLYERGIPVAIAGLLGAAVGAIWNYTLSTQYAWRQARPR
jgi:dolichol-phosphate mannosyltransferase